MLNTTNICRAIVCALALLPTLALAQELAGPARVIDGDTIVIGTTHVRLHGIDAPEADQTCGLGAQVYACGTVATQALRNFVGNQQVRCLGTGLDRYGRTLAACTVGGTDIERWMVRNGFAIAYRHYSMDYAADEDAARAEHRGIWAGSFEEPYLWRREHPHYGYSHSFTYVPRYYPYRIR